MKQFSNRYLIIAHSNNDQKNIALYFAQQCIKLKLKYKIYCLDEETFQFLVKNSIDAEREFCNKEYNYLYRYELLIKLLENQYADHKLIYSDIDCVPLSSAIQELSIAYDAEIAISISKQESAIPESFRRKFGFTFCTGFFICGKKSINFLKKFVNEWYSGANREAWDRLISSCCYKSLDDQRALNTLFEDYFREIQEGLFETNLGTIQVIPTEIISRKRKEKIEEELAIHLIKKNRIEDDSFFELVRYHKL